MEWVEFAQYVNSLVKLALNLLINVKHAFKATFFLRRTYAYQSVQTDTFVMLSHQHATIALHNAPPAYKHRLIVLVV